MDVHFRDERRPVGARYIGSTRADGTGYQGQVVQYPVICAEDIVEERAHYGPVTSVTSVKALTTCRDCKERLT